MAHETVDMNAEVRESVAGAVVNGSFYDSVVSGMMVVEVDPDNVKTDPTFRGLRSWSGNSRQELALKELALAIYEEGQADPVKLWESEEGLVIFDGNRRYDAVQIIRDEWDATFMLRGIVYADMTFDKALRLAMHSDSQHEKFTVVEMGRNIQLIRERYKFDNSVAGTKEVAKYLGVSSATITQAERLLKAPVETQELVESGRLSATSALDLLSTTSRVAEGKREETQRKVIEEAGRLAEEEKEKKRKAAAEGVEAAEGNGKKGKGKGAGEERELSKEQQRVAANVQRDAARDRQKKKEAEKLAAERKRLEEEGKDGGQEEGKGPLFAEDRGEEEGHGGEEGGDPGVEGDGVGEGEGDGGEGTYAEPTADQSPAVIEGRHVRQAAKTILGDESKLKAPKMGEAITLIETWAGPAYPTVMMKFADTFCAWAHGKKSDKVLEAAWDDIADVVHKAQQIVDRGAQMDAVVSKIVEAAGSVEVVLDAVVAATVEAESGEIVEVAEPEPAQTTLIPTATSTPAPSPVPFKIAKPKKKVGEVTAVAAESAEPVEVPEAQTTTPVAEQKSTRAAAPKATTKKAAAAPPPPPPTKKATVKVATKKAK